VSLHPCIAPESTDPLAACRGCRFDTNPGCAREAMLQLPKRRNALETLVYQWQALRQQRLPAMPRCPGRKRRVRRLRSQPMCDPATEVDFCECARGRQGLRWAREGFCLLPGLAAAFMECAECNEGGIRVYSGEHNTHGTMVMMLHKAAPRLDAGLIRAACQKGRD
jgi:hypothetical protein